MKLWYNNYKSFNYTRKKIVEEEEATTAAD